MVPLEVLVELDTADEHKEMFESTWKDALKILKTLSEGSNGKFS
jgi:hypothetical protein